MTGPTAGEPAVLLNVTFFTNRGGVAGACTFPYVIVPLTEGVSAGVGVSVGVSVAVGVLVFVAVGVLVAVAAGAATLTLMILDAERIPFVNTVTSEYPGGKPG